MLENHATRIRGMQTSNEATKHYIHGDQNRQEKIHRLHSITRGQSVLGDYGLASLRGSTDQNPQMTRHTTTTTQGHRLSPPTQTNEPKTTRRTKSLRSTSCLAAKRPLPEVTVRKDTCDIVNEERHDSKLHGKARSSSAC